MNVTMATAMQTLLKPSWQEQRQTPVPFPLATCPLKLGTPRNLVSSTVSCWEKKRTEAAVPAAREGAHLQEYKSTV